MIYIGSLSQLTFTWSLFGVFFENFEEILQIVPAFPLLALNK